jgi:hypothetical protein
VAGAAAALPPGSLPDVADAPQPAARELAVPPPLSTRLTDPNRPVAVGTALWFLAFVALLIAHYGFGAGSTLVLTTCLSGWVLGLIGLGILYWQRSAARRGSRSAQRIEE